MKAPHFVLIVLGLGVVFGFMGWALWSIGGFRGVTGGSLTIALMVAAGALTTALLAGGLMWLAFWSSKKGYDETVEFEDRDDDPSGDGSAPD